MNKKIKYIVLGLIAILLLQVPLNVSAQNDKLEKWKNFDIRTKAPDSFTAEVIDKHYDGVSGSKLKGIGKTVMKYSEEYGINPIFVVGVMNHESAHGTSDLAKNNYNFGGIKKNSRVPDSKNGWAKFNSPEDGVKDLFTLLNLYTKGEIGSDGKLTTFMDILKIYAPASDIRNNHSDYVTNVVSYMEKNGQTPDGSMMAEDKEVEKEKKKKGYEAPDLFIEPHSASKIGGLGSSDVPIGNESTMKIQYISEQVKDKLIYFSWFAVAGLLVYMSVSIMAYVVAVRGTLGGTLFEKMTGIKDEIYTRKTLYRLIGRMFLALVLVVFFATGLFIVLMERILSFISYLPIIPL